MKKLNAICDVDWISNNMKEDFYTNGRIGRYEGTLLVELPQRFTDKTYTTKIMGDNILSILPQINNDKMVKVVDYGNTEIDEINEKGEAYGRIDDIKKYEVQRTMGVGIVISHQFGQWTI